MNILITGGAGFIGANLSLRLVEEGHNVTVLDNLSPQIHGSDPNLSSPLYGQIKNKVRFLQASVSDANIWARCIPGQDVIVHLAAETGTGQSMYEIERYVDVNIMGTAGMLGWLSRNDHGIKRIVVASSRAIYGEGKYTDEHGNIIYPCARLDGDMQNGIFDVLCAHTRKPLKPLPTDEGSKIHPSSVYGITKQNQEQLVMTVSPTIGIEGVALRYQNVYGPGQSLKNPYTGILSIFSTRALNGNEIQIFEDGLESRDFVYIDDVVEATYLALTKSEAANQVFGVGSGVATNVLDVAKSLIKAYASEVPITITGAFRMGDIRHNFADLSKAQKILGFKPRVCFQAGIKLFSSWVLKQQIEEDNYQRSIDEMKRRGLYRE